MKFCSSMQIFSVGYTDSAGLTLNAFGPWTHHLPALSSLSPPDRKQKAFVFPLCTSCCTLWAPKPFWFHHCQMDFLKATRTSRRYIWTRLFVLLHRSQVRGRWRNKNKHLSYSVFSYNTVRELCVVVLSEIQHILNKNRTARMLKIKYLYFLIKSRTYLCSLPLSSKWIVQFIVCIKKISSGSLIN